MVGLIDPWSGLLIKGSGGAAYSGPGDVVSGALAWWGCRGYSAAYSTGSNPAMDVVDASTGLITTTVNILSDGNLDDGTILGLGYAVVVKKLYDQTGNGNHLTQATLANMPALTQNASGSLPAMTFAGSQRLTVASLTQSQPYSTAAVAKRTSTTTYNAILATKDDSSGIFFRNAVNSIALFAGGSGLVLGATDNTWHAIQGVADGASSIIAKDGTSNTGNPGTSSTGGGTMSLGNDTSNEALNGLIGEAGMWPAAFSETDITNMNSNQHTYWGF